MDSAQELLSTSIIVFREAFEALLIVSIISVALYRLGRSRMQKYLLIGAVMAVIAGIVLGAFILWLYGGFPEKELFEATASIIAAILIMTVVYWLTRVGSRLRREIEARVAVIASAAGLVAFSFIIVFREALETVLFITPFLVAAPMATTMGIVLGVLSASIISLLTRMVGLRISLHKFFQVTSILLLLVASGLIGYSVHEFIEWLKEDNVDLGWLAQKAYDLGLPPDHPLHNKQPLGAVLAVLTGYSVSMEWGRLLAQTLFLVVGLALITKAYRARQK